MGAKGISIQDLFLKSRSLSSARYTQFKGVKFKTNEFKDIDPQYKERLEMGEDPNWCEIDKKLEELNKKYESTTDFIKREIISLKYDLLVEGFIETDPDRVEKLQIKLQKLIELSEAR